MGRNKEIVDPRLGEIPKTRILKGKRVHDKFPAIHAL